jgi:hypothetical protein
MDQGVSDDIHAAIGSELDEADREALRTLQGFVQPLFFMAGEMTAAMGRWLLASMLAVNGGAAIAVMNAPRPVANNQAALVSWVVGIVLALISGLVSMYNGQRSITVAGDMMASVLKSIHLGKFHDLRFDEQTAPLTRLGRVATGIGVLSMLAFIAGAILAAS